MHKNQLFVIVYLILLTLSQFLFFNQVTYAQEFQQFQGYNSELNFKSDFEYKLLDYNSQSEDSKSPFNNFIKNYAYINQNGNQNQSEIFQIGNFGSIVEVIQIGNENKTAVKQFASSAKADIFQFGDSHDLSIEQWGTEAKIYVIQSGNNFENKEMKIVQF